MVHCAQNVRFILSGQKKERTFICINQCICISVFHVDGSQRLACTIFQYTSTSAILLQTITSWQDKMVFLSFLKLKRVIAPILINIVSRSILIALPRYCNIYSACDNIKQYSYTKPKIHYRCKWIKSFSGVRVAQSLAFWVVFCKSLFILLSFFCHYFVCPPLIYDFCLPLWYLDSFLITHLHKRKATY